jgi:hypothetical protein
MSDKKPNVFPTQEQINEANAVGAQLALNQETGIPNATPVDDPIAQSQPSTAEQNAAEEMRRRTQEQMMLRNHAEQKTQENKSEGIKMREELMKQMNQNNPTPQVQPSITPQTAQDMTDTAMSYEQMTQFENYAKMVDEKKKNNPTPTNPDGSINYAEQGYNRPPAPPTPPTPPTPPSNVGRPDGMEPPQPPSNDEYITHLSQPQYDAPYDVIPLPSEGKLYKNKKSSIKVAYMTTGDENILTSPNLLTSGRFLEILMNRKILEPELRYEDLIEGDRDAIMLWLRATGYGNMYPVQVLDENGTAFETEIDLNEIKTVNLTTEPDKQGLFTFKLPLSQKEVKIKLLTVGEDEEIAKRVEHELETLNLPVDNSATYRLMKQVVSVDGNTDPEAISKFVNTMRMKDGEDLKEFIESIDCGVDLSITVGTPGGGSVNTFLPINLKFFWPNLGL